MSTLGKDFKAAFGSVWALIGVLISSVAVFNWLSGVLQIGLSALFAQLLGALRSVFHPIIEFLTGWAIPWLPFLALPEWKDGLVLWFAVGGAVARSLYSLISKVATTPHSKTFGPLDLLIVPRWKWPFTMVFTIALWPATLGLMWAKPIAEFWVSGGYFLHEADWRKGYVDPEVYNFDLRVVFAMQLAAVIAVVVCLVFLNAAGMR